MKILDFITWKILALIGLILCLFGIVIGSVHWWIAIGFETIEKILRLLIRDVKITMDKINHKYGV